MAAAKLPSSPSRPTLSLSNKLKRPQPSFPKARVCRKEDPTKTKQNVQTSHLD